MNPIDNILEQYKSLSEHEKISLFLSLQQLDMREHYDPSYKRYRLRVTNKYGKYLIDKTISNLYNLREAKREAYNHMNNLTQYMSERETYMTKDEIYVYRNMAYDEIIITEL